MGTFLVAIGAVSGTLLIVILLTSVFSRRHRFWPTPEHRSARGLTFWVLFRTLNVAVITRAALMAPDVLATGHALGVPGTLRGAALVVLAAGLAVYVSALVALGGRNTYCSRAGLTTHGLYRWSRNPQYAAIIPVYAVTAIAADDWPVMALCGCLIASYWLMALAEESWLVASYGTRYAAYRRSVPRFFNWRRAVMKAAEATRALTQPRRASSALARRCVGRERRLSYFVSSASR